MQRRRIPWMGWWYLALSIGFAALAIDHVLIRDVWWSIGVRVIIAAGFALLAWMELRK